MRSLVVMTLCAALTGCALAPPAIDLPPAPSIGAPLSVGGMPDPRDLGARPDAHEGRIGSEPAMCFGAAAAHALLQRDIAAVANTGIAASCKAGHAELLAAYDELYLQADAIAQAYGAAAAGWADADRQRAAEHLRSRLEVWTYRVLLMLVTGAALR